MYTEWYAKISRSFRDAGTTRLLARANAALAYAVAAAYIAAIIWLIACDSGKLALFIAVPAATFIAATALRAALDRPRPYEAFPIDPVLAPKTRGRSLPSRHMASAAAIAFAFSWLAPIAGIFAWMAAAGVAFTRIVGGAHFPRDILAALALACACAALGFFAIPAIMGA